MTFEKDALFDRTAEKTSIFKQPYLNFCNFFNQSYNSFVEAC